MELRQQATEGTKAVGGVQPSCPTMKSRMPAASCSWTVVERAVVGDGRGADYSPATAMSETVAAPSRSFFTSRYSAEL
jgi:hypothetical protein